MKFHLDSRAILKSAVQLALRLNAAAVEIGHLLMCDPEERVESFEIRDIPFSPEVVRLLQAAAELVHRESSTIIRPRHLQIALNSSTGISPDWGFQRHRVLMSQLLDHSLAGLLACRGVDVQSLRRQLQGLTVRECRPGREFRDTPAGRRFAALAERLGTKNDAALLLLLLSYLLCEGPAAGPLLQAGVSEALLVELLEQRPEELRQPPTFAFDFTQLGADLCRLGMDVRQTLEIAWILRDGPELRGRDLLRGLVATSNPLEECNVQILLTRISEYDFTDVLINQRAADPKSKVVLSPEIHRVIDTAWQEAGPDALLNNFHVLIALAECGDELLGKNGVTAEKIRRTLTS